jgi:hypothetical protein
LNDGEHDVGLWSEDDGTNGDGDILKASVTDFRHAGTCIIEQFSEGRLPATSALLILPAWIVPMLVRNEHSTMSWKEAAMLRSSPAMRESQSLVHRAFLPNETILCAFLYC